MLLVLVGPSIGVHFAGWFHERVWQQLVLARQSSRSLSWVLSLAILQAAPFALSSELFPALVSRFRLVACHSRRAAKHYKSSASFRHFDEHFEELFHDVTRGYRVREKPRKTHASCSTPVPPRPIPWHHSGLQSPWKTPREAWRSAPQTDPCSEYFPSNEGESRQLENVSQM